jgi:hypothetical protein
LEVVELSVTFVTLIEQAHKHQPGLSITMVIK